MKANLLYLSHCLPTEPDKGERIRAYHELCYLADRYNVHVVCTGKAPSNDAQIERMRKRCASFYFEPLSEWAGALRSSRFLFGRSALTVAYYHSSKLARVVKELTKELRLDAAMAFSTAMAPYGPAGVPLLLDMVDVDSAKWASYADLRRWKWFYRREARRLQAAEQRYSRAAEAVLLTSAHEAELLHRAVPEIRVRVIRNGVDAAYFDPQATPPSPELQQRHFVAIVGAMSYFPNVDGAVWFTNEVLPRLRAVDDIEFFIVGHSPQSSVERLASIPWVKVTGSVPDVRPYIANAVAIVVPLRVARGIQNKVLEALAMGKRVLASPAVAMTFENAPPPGVTVCNTAEEYVREIVSLGRCTEADPCIRDSVIGQYQWETQLRQLDEELQRILNG